MKQSMRTAVSCSQALVELYGDTLKFHCAAGSSKVQLPATAYMTMARLPPEPEHEGRSPPLV